MSDSQDRLEGLLDSISKAREDVDNTYRQDSEKAEQRAHKRAMIGPDDDFVRESGLSDVTPVRGNRRNLKKALSEDDFLSQFEDMLDDEAPQVDSADDDFSGTATDDVSADEDSLPDGEDVSPYFSKIGEPEQKETASPKDDLMDDISSIVSNAKEKAGESILSSKDNSSSESEEDSENSFDDINLDDVDLDDTSAKDVDLMDDNGDGNDLSDMLSSDGELSDIGDLLSADEAGDILPESADSFEESADDVAEESGKPAQVESDQADDTHTEKQGFFSKLISRLKKAFSKEDTDDSLSADDIFSDHMDSAEELSDENADIMAGFEDESADQGKKKAAKPRKAKKEKKPKEPKATKPPKPKKQKEPDNSPVIPVKVIGVFFVLAISVFALVFAGVNFLPKEQLASSAEEDYSKQKYVDAYRYYAAVKNPDKKDRTRLRGSELAASITLRYNSYEVAMERKSYDFALDALVRGYAYYAKNSSEAKKLDISRYFADYGQRITEQLHDQFGLSQSDASSIAAIKDRTSYTSRINEVLTQRGLRAE